MDHILLQTFKIIFSTLLKKHEAIADNPPVQIYTNRIKNRIAFKIKTGYKLELLSPETIKLLGSIKKDDDQDEDRQGVPKFAESVEDVVVPWYLVSNSHQKASKVLFTFVPDEKFGQLITISPHSLKMLKTTNAEFQSIEVWFTNQNNRPLEVEDNVNITLIFG